MSDFDDFEEAAVSRPWRVWLHSTSGMYEQYDGYVDVRVAVDSTETHSSRHELFAAAVKELARTSFPDRRGLDFWRFERAERL